MRRSFSNMIKKKKRKHKNELHLTITHREIILKATKMTLMRSLFKGKYKVKTVKVKAILVVFLARIIFSKR
jgi:hypothetical protein